MGGSHTERIEARRRWWGTGKAVLVRATVSLIASLLVLNVLGAIATGLVAVFVVPEPQQLKADASLTTYIVLAAIYFVAAIVGGVVMGVRSLSSLAEWLPSERPPTPEQQLRVLRGPRSLARGIGVLWLGATVLFGALTAHYSTDAALRIAAIVGLSGVITSAVTFRLAERLLREAAARALSASDHPQRIAQSVAVRSLMTWVAGTGAPVFGVVLLGVASLVDGVGTRRELAIATAVLGANCLLAGFLTTLFVTRATADPIISVRRALARIEQGELDVSVPVYDGTDIGLLQAGFNRMAAGLRERERLRDLFGRHVGVDVARHALEHEVQLGGEQRDVAVLYIDIVGSTKIAGRLPPVEVVELLNRFFATVIDVVEAEGGFINKFAGDAALAIFGAPVPQDDRHLRALDAARNLARRVAEEVPEVDFGIGVASGVAVAGNVGATRRFEYTVIGDPVNEAARLGELAKGLPGRVAASGDTVDAARCEGWSAVSEVELRGRVAATRVFLPRVDV
ncbi:MAG TPA: adenylate/guanylate cyclase domain-containing protein [Mycobacteriales bacterium]|nr:adenylate/guanylate cyclase domain-containing protein [Mycobacteriales bacterium]